MNRFSTYFVLSTIILTVLLLIVYFIPGVHQSQLEIEIAHPHASFKEDIACMQGWQDWYFSDEGHRFEIKGDSCGKGAELIWNSPYESTGALKITQFKNDTLCFDLKSDGGDFAEKGIMSFEGDSLQTRIQLSVQLDLSANPRAKVQSLFADYEQVLQQHYKLILNQLKEKYEAQ